MREIRQQKCGWNTLTSKGDDFSSVYKLSMLNILLKHVVIISYVYHRAFGDSKHLRKLFPRALQNTKDWPESIGKVWLNYERDEGTLESYEHCIEKIKGRLKQISEQREKERAKQAEEFESHSNRRMKRAGLGFKEKNSVRNNEPSEPKKITGYKRKQTGPEEPSVSPSKKSKANEDVQGNGKSETPQSSEDIVKKLLNEKEQGNFDL